MIIFLNGASSVGKSSIARDIMRQSDRPFIYFSVDHLVNFWIDQKFVVFEEGPADWFYHELTLDEEGKQEVKIMGGPHAIQLHWDMIEAITVLIEKGYDLIIDEVLWGPIVFQHYIPALSKANRVYMIKVICDLIECERREEARSDRLKGLARGVYKLVYQDYPYYDLEIDTTSDSSEECAKQILDHVNKHDYPDAFKRSLQKKLEDKPSS